LLELFPLAFGDDQEQRESALRAVREILVDRPVRARPLPIPDVAGDLSRWTTYVSRCIKAARKEQGLTQVELATKAGIPQPHLSRLERGDHSPTRLTLEKLAKALKVPVSRFDPNATD
jgi:ribosome-binding protein aMBF1 (putative translation factor)